MPLVTPEEIADKAQRAYPRFLKQWIRGEAADYFPLRLRVNLRKDPQNPKATIAAIEKLLVKSNVNRGWGYTVHREQKASRDFGSNRFPTAVTIDTLEDLLRLADQREHFAATCEVAEKIRRQLPALEQWLRDSVNTVAKLRETCDGLILVAKFFRENPRPNCYAKQIPVCVDTKFINDTKNQTKLRNWLDIVLPPSAIDVNETQFARRFGLRDFQPHRGIRLLDPQLSGELGLPDGDMSLPLSSIAELSARDVALFVVENDLNLVTMPCFKRGIGICGRGNSVNLLEHVKWLSTNRVLYWGDIDHAGFTILSRLRNLFPHVESILMDLGTLETHREYVVSDLTSAQAVPTNLNFSEQITLEHCLNTNERLEQEKILQPYVDRVFTRLA